MAKYQQSQSDYLIKPACSDVNIAGGILRRALDWNEPDSNLADALLKANCEPVKTVIGKLDEYGKQRLEQLAKEVNHGNSN